MIYGMFACFLVCIMLRRVGRQTGRAEDADRDGQGKRVSSQDARHARRLPAGRGHRHVHRLRHKRHTTDHWFYLEKTSNKNPKR